MLRLPVLPRRCRENEARLRRDARRDGPCCTRSAHFPSQSSSSSIVQILHTGVALLICGCGKSGKSNSVGREGQVRNVRLLCAVDSDTLRTWHFIAW
jgi:hypothetical protein